MSLVSVRVHDQSVALQCDEQALPIVAKALGDITLEKIDSGTPIRVLHIAVEQPTSSISWTIDDQHRNSTLTGNTIGDLGYYLTDCLTYHFADLITSAHCIHAAAVEIDGKAIVLAGQSGAGKSTLRAHLVAQGAKYITDELTVITPKATVTGLPRPIQIKPQGMNAIEGLVNTPDGILKGTAASGLPISALNAVATFEAVPLGAIFFPKYEADASYELLPISSARAGLKMMECFVNARHLESYGFDALIEIIKRVPTYSVTYPQLSSIDFLRSTLI